MNDKLTDLVISFFNDVSFYIYEEYPDYYKHFHRDKELSKTFNMIQQFYLGGNNVPDSASYMIEYFKGDNNVRPL
jgi:hypothetical protein